MNKSNPVNLRNFPSTPKKKTPVTKLKLNQASILKHKTYHLMAKLTDQLISAQFIRCQK